MNWRGKICLICQLCFLWLDFYSAYVLLPDPLGIVMTSGVTFSVTIIAKFIIIWLNQKKYYLLVVFTLELFNKNTSGIKERILFNTTETIFRHFKLVLVGMGCAMMVHSSIPFYDFVFRGILTKVSPIMFPYLDDTVLKGYLISFSLNVFWVGWSLIGVYAVSCMFLMYVDVYDALVSLVETDLKEFDYICDQKFVNINRRNAAFRNIVMEFMDIARFSAYMNERFNLIATVQMGSTFLSLTTILYGVLMTDFISGIGAGIYYVTEIFMFSFIGQLMVDTTDRISEVICKTEWYKYDLSCQKDLMFLLRIMQRVECVRIANVYPLNFELGVNIMKNIYTILMFLVEVA